MDILEWVQNHNSDKNLLVKELAAKTHGDTTEEDLKLAKETLKKRFVVGLMNEMEESIHRFNNVMGIDEEDNAKNTKCMKSYFGTRVRKENSNAHPKVSDTQINCCFHILGNPCSLTTLSQLITPPLG